MTKYFDFDAFKAEQEEEVITIKIYGEEEHLPASPPAGMILDIMRMQAEGGGEVPANHVERMAVGLFTQERLDKWFAKGMVWSDMEVLIKQTTQMYFSKQIEDASAKKK